MIGWDKLLEKSATHIRALVVVPVIGWDKLLEKLTSHIRAFVVVPVI